MSGSWVDEKCLVEVRGQRRMGRLVRNDRKATVTQITTHYNQGMQNTISERTKRWTLKQMGYSSRRPHRVPLRSAKNRKRRLQFAQAHQNWTIEDWKKVACSDESRGGGGKHGSILPCLNGSGWWWWCNVWGIFSWHTLSPLVPIEHCLNATAYRSHKAQIISEWFLEHDNEFTLLKWPPQSPDLNPIEHPWDVVEREIRIMDVQPTNLLQLRDAIMSIWTKISEECFQHLVESMPRRIKAVLKAKWGPTRY